MRINSRFAKYRHGGLVPMNDTLPFRGGGYLPMYADGGKQPDPTQGMPRSAPLPHMVHGNNPPSGGPPPSAFGPMGLQALEQGQPIPQEWLDERGNVMMQPMTLGPVSNPIPIEDAPDYKLPGPGGARHNPALRRYGGRMRQYAKGGKIGGKKGCGCVPNEARNQF